MANSVSSLSAHSKIPPEVLRGCKVVLLLPPIILVVDSEEKERGLKRFLDESTDSPFVLAEILELFSKLQEDFRITSTRVDHDPYRRYELIVEVGFANKIK